MSWLERLPESFGPAHKMKLLTLFDTYLGATCGQIFEAVKSDLHRTAAVEAAAAPPVAPARAAGAADFAADVALQPGASSPHAGDEGSVPEDSSWPEESLLNWAAPSVLGGESTWGGESDGSPPSWVACP